MTTENGESSSINERSSIGPSHLKKTSDEELLRIKNSFLALLSKDQNPIKDLEGTCIMSSEDLDPYRLIGDSAIDHILKLLQSENSKLGAMEDFILMAEKATATDPSTRTPSQAAMSDFLTKYKTLPKWADKEQLKRGQEVFLAYAPVCGLSLFYRSLVPGFSIPKINAVIQATAYLAPPSTPDQSLQRIIDTGELLSACVSLGIESLTEPDGVGWKTAIYVRILHAKVRYALLQRTGKRKWDVEKYGIPINQEDLAATLLAFSVNVLVGIDLISGSSLSDEERTDYLALWRYIGWLLGVETETDTRTKGEPDTKELPPLDPCGPPRKDNVCKNTIQRSYALLESIIFHLGDPDDSSVRIAHHLLQITDRKPPKDIQNVSSFYKNGLFYYRSLQCRKLIGEPLANALELPFHPNVWKRALIYATSAFVWSVLRVYTLASMYSPFCRKTLVGFHSRQFVNFHNYWNQTHTSKMADMARKRVSNKINQSNMCPFAMVAPPNN